MTAADVRTGRAAAALALLAAAVASGPAAAQSARLYALADSVSAGERFRIAVAVDHAPGRQTLFPEVPFGDPEAGPLLALGDAEAFEARRFPPEVRGAIRTDSVVYTVAAFAVDSALVGPVSVRVVAGADTAVVRTGVAVVPVRSVLEGPPPHEPAPVGPAGPFPSAAPVWAALGALALLVVGALAWGLRRALRRTAPAHAVAPYPAALGRLRALEAETPETPAEIEAHVVAARGVLRQYLGRRLGVPAEETTTDELDAALRADARVPDGDADAVRRALLPTDLVAFAGLRLAPADAARVRAAVRAAVEAVEAAVRAREQTEARSAPGGDGAGTAAPPSSRVSHPSSP